MLHEVDYELNLPVGVLFEANDVAQAFVVGELKLVLENRKLISNVANELIDVGLLFDVVGATLRRAVPSLSDNKFLAAFLADREKSVASHFLDSLEGLFHKLEELLDDGF